MKPRLRRAPCILAALYFAWSSLVYFGSRGSVDHAWWPISLYGPIWPWSWGIEALLDLIRDWLAPDPQSAAESVFLAMDWAAGGCYILVGSVWYWCLGKLASLSATRLFGTRNRPEPGQGKAS